MKVICHMHTSIDGKISGEHLKSDAAKSAMRVYYDLFLGKNAHYKRHSGWLSGRVTSDDNFTFYKKPSLNENAPKVPDGELILTLKHPL